MDTENKLDTQGSLAESADEKTDGEALSHTPGDTTSHRRDYLSFQGCDIRAIVLGESQTPPSEISYEVKRSRSEDQSDVIHLGPVTPMPFSRGKRGIAGTLVNLMLDRRLLDGEE